MDIGAIFLLLSVFLLAGLFVARPFLERRRISNASAGDQELSTLLAERDRLIGTLQELDFDHTLGKIPAQDYPAMRANLLQRASDALRKIDAIQSATDQGDAESRVEAVIAARRSDAAAEEAKPAGVSDDDIEELVAARRAARKEKSAGFCPKCGKPILRSDRFCPSCGKAIS